MGGLVYGVCWGGERLIATVIVCDWLSERPGLGCGGLAAERGAWRELWCVRVSARGSDPQVRLSGGSGGGWCRRVVSCVLS